MSMLRSPKTLSEKVFLLISSGKIQSTNETILHLFPDEVAINVNVFGALVKDRVSNYLNSRFPVTEYGNRQGNSDP